MGNQEFLPDGTDPRRPSKICQTAPGEYHVHSCGGCSGYPINELINDEGYVGTELGGVQRKRPRLETDPAAHSGGGVSPNRSLRTSIAS